MPTAYFLDQPLKGDKRRTRSSTHLTVPDSSDEADELLENEPLETHIPPKHRVLKEVSIMKKEVVPAQTIDQGSSVGSPSLDNSEYETPGTSISTTPAPLRSGKSTRNSSVGIATVATSSKKRGKQRAIPDSEDEVEEMDLDMSADAQLARQLQMEEDAYEQNVPKRRRIDIIEDSEEELSDLLSELFSEEEEEEPQPYTGKGKGRAVDPPRRATRSRTAPKDLIELSDFEEDEFIPDDGSDKGPDFMDLFSDDDEPLMNIKKRAARPAASTPAKGKGKKKTLAQMSAAEKRQKRDAALAARMEFDHIEDKWERKRAMNRKRAEGNHPKLLTMWDDLAAIPVLDVQKAEQPESITRRLKPFQLEGLSWMIRQEKTDYKGGLLGDEMGMGKTIQAVSLIMSDYPQKAPTLVVVPPVALMQWSNEIREYTDGKLKVLVYHGTNQKIKKMTVKDLNKFDVIMVSYNSLESLHRKETKGWSRGENIVKEASPLHAITYHRLILDEAHSIKSRTTGVAKACFALKGSYKWCLSGTPVQNRIGEFFSLLRFLEVRPFADYFCRSCDCEQLHWQVDEDHMCAKCDHGGSEHISVFNQELLNPITGDDPELRETALEKLHMITARIMLRRMKRDHTNSMELPMKDIIIHNEFFSEFERDFSSSIMTNSSRKFDTYVAQGVMLNK